MNLVIDVGNTRGKYAFFEEDRLVEIKYRLDSVFEDIGRWKEKGKRMDIFLSGSGRIEEEIRLLLKKSADTWLEASPQMPVPLVIDYTTPHTLGFDRIAVCVGAIYLEPAHPLLVIDSGTAITFNYVDAKGVFLGGNISPGQEMRFRGLHQFTARLPYVVAVENYGGIGRTTEEAIRNGVMTGILFEVENYIRCFKAENPDGRVLLTGGNAHFLVGHLISDVRFCKELGFIGLNRILKYSKKN